MIQGTTPTLLFNLPFATSIIKSAEITIQYVDNYQKIVIEKALANCEVGDTTIGLRLTQAETLQFPAPSTLQVQLRVLTNDGLALATEIMSVSVENLLAEDVIV